MDRAVNPPVDEAAALHCPPPAADTVGDDLETGSAAAAEDAAGYQPLWVRLACILLDFLTQTYDQIRIVPEIVLFERWICTSYFPDLGGGLGGGGEVCNSPEVQYELARLRSWKAFFDGVASMT